MELLLIIFAVLGALSVGLLLKNIWADNNDGHYQSDYRSKDQIRAEFRRLNGLSSRLEQQKI